jgi:hypothetical protein
VAATVQRVLPDGAYTWVIEAVADDGQMVKEQGQITIVGADVEIPQLANFAVAPHAFTPNQDGIGDRVAITYYQTKEASVRMNVVGDDGQKHPIVEREREARAGEPGMHFYDYHGGVDDGADPPADGDYLLVAEVEDAVGNMVVMTSTLTIVDGGVPRADIVQGDVEFWPRIVPLGETLYFTATVENFGTVPIRTTGPEPGTNYRSDENFNALGNYEEPGAWRLGIDFETNSSGRPYPYRWALGNDGDLDLRMRDGETLRYLLPGDRVVVTGSITLVDAPPRNPIYFWAGLIHEDVRIESYNDHVDPQQISVGF